MEKPDTCFRIFVFGESTTRGYPYQEGTSFPPILYYRLQDAFPHKRIEVINLSASAINSYSFIDMLPEVLDNKPDAILVYGRWLGREWRKCPLA
jgi:lysophospholipase L1-like esterase